METAVSVSAVEMPLDNVRVLAYNVRLCRTFSGDE